MNNKKIQTILLILLVALLISISISTVCFAEEPKEAVTDTFDRQDAENRMRDIVYKIDTLDINLYDDSPELQHMLEVFRVSANELNNLSQWTDAVLIERLYVLESTYSSLEKREDKVQLSELVKKARIYDYEAYGNKFNDRQQAKLDKLLLECDSALANTMCNEDSITDLTKRLTDFMKPYAPYPWWSWLIIAIVTIIISVVVGHLVFADTGNPLGMVFSTIAQIITIAISVTLCYCTVLLWWHTLLIFIGSSLLLSGIAGGIASIFS